MHSFQKEKQSSHLKILITMLQTILWCVCCCFFLSLSLSAYCVVILWYSCFYFFRLHSWLCQIPFRYLTRYSRQMWTANSFWAYKGRPFHCSDNAKSYHLWNNNSFICTSIFRSIEPQSWNTREKGQKFSSTIELNISGNGRMCMSSPHQKKKNK